MKPQLASRGEWHNAAARARQAAHILTYLGRHVLMLTSMILRDYLELKVGRDVCVLALGKADFSYLFPDS